MRFDSLFLQQEKEKIWLECSRSIKNPVPMIIMNIIMMNTSMKSTTICTLFQQPLALQMLVKLAKGDETKTEIEIKIETKIEIKLLHQLQDQVMEATQLLLLEKDVS